MMQEYRKWDVVCPNCHKAFFETNPTNKRIQSDQNRWWDKKTGKWRYPDNKGHSRAWIANPFLTKYDPNLPFNATMVVMKEPWKSWGWAHHQTDRYNLECPGCNHIIAGYGQKPILRWQGNQDWNLKIVRKNSFWINSPHGKCTVSR
jgi:hypothetical protein